MQLQNIKTIFTLLVILLGFNSLAIEKPIDKIVAKVGNEIVLLSDIQNGRLQMIMSGYEGDDQTDCMLLEELLVNKLLLVQAELDSVVISDEMVNIEMEDRIRYFSQQFGGIENMEKQLEKSVAQIKAEARDQIKNRMLAQRMMMQITETVDITPKEIETFYNGLHKDSIPYINSKVTIAQIVIYPEVTENDRQIAYDKLSQLRQAIVSGKKGFGPAAAINSMDPGSRFQGGELGWQTRGTMVPEFEAELFRLKKDSISPIFETMYGFHIIQLMDRRGDNYLCRHILITPEVSTDALLIAANKIDSVYKEIKKGNITFEEAAAKYSHDDESKNKGGKIVNPYTGEFQWDIQNVNEIDPQMSSILGTLNKNEISKPSLYENFMERKNGVRIVKLLEKTKPHLANLKDDYQLIKMAAENEKKQKILDKWINDRVSDIYVWIDPAFAAKCKFKYNWIQTVAAVE